MKNILCIETSCALCSVAVQSGDRIFEREADALQNHAESLAGLISDVLNDAGISMHDLHAVALSDGPGSYTGLRIGASTAKGICFSLNIPLLPLSTLRILAHAVRSEYQTGNKLVWPMIDARRMEVYHALFDGDLRQIVASTNGIIDQPGFRPEAVTDDTVLCGDGAGKAAAILGLPVLPVLPHARRMCALAQEALQAGSTADLTSYQPFYLKQANITRPAKP